MAAPGASMAARPHRANAQRTQRRIERTRTLGASPSLPNLPQNRRLTGQP